MELEAAVRHARIWACQSGDLDGEMVRLLVGEIDRLRAELAECRRTRALGGPPPPVDKNWANANVGRPSSADDPNAPALRRDRSGGEPG